ncbi:hypothetical protein S40288_07368 [Stachybotrys chartarum IBT 40288]|nr:hypothetical protein S40288_07368 [Stachybotrys chartarum IBT 40288]
MWAGLLWVFLSVAAAQSHRAGSTNRPFIIRRNAPSHSRQSRLIPVVVGGPQDTFVPNAVQANVGDVIQFQFSSGNHTVTQSTADIPCQPLQATNPAAIHSGHIPFADGQATVGTFNLPINSVDTLFLYCATGPHCQEGQVMVINPVNDQQLLQYAKLSMSTTASIDGGAISGGLVGQIPLDQAAFVPAPAQEAPPAAPAAPGEQATPIEQAPPAEQVPPVERARIRGEPVAVPIL